MAKIVLTISVDNKATQSVRLLNAEVQTLSKTLSSIKVNKNLTTQINALTKHYKAVADAHAKIIANKNKEAIADEKLRQQQAKTALTLQKENTEISKQAVNNARAEKTTYSLTQAKEKASQATQKQTAATKANTIVNNNNTQSIGSMTVNIFKWQLAMTSVMKPLRLLQDAWASLGETLVKTEDSVIAIQRVLSENIVDGEISSRLYKIAQDYGQTFENVSQIAQNFARTGMPWADTIKATEAAVLALNVAELDAEEATTGMVAILSQFGLEASDLETVIDKLNKTADNFPVTTEKILAALQRTGSAAANANLNLDQTISLITALSKATGRSGENLGTALNSLIQYSSKASALDVFAGLSDNTASVVAEYRKGAKDILDVWQAVAAEIKNLDSRQADLLDSYFTTEDGNALTEALDEELQDIYTELGGVYDTANTFRKNYFIALLGNMDTVEQAMGTLQGAAGYSQDENQKYLDTYTAKLNTLKAQWEDIANSEQGLLWVKKLLVDIGSVLLTIVKWTGGLRTTLLAIATVVWTLVGTKIIAGIKSIGTAIGGLLTTLRTAKTVAEGLNAALGWIGVVGTALSLIIGGITTAISEYNTAQEAANKKAVERWQAIQSEAQQLEELSNKYKKLSINDEQYAEVEKGIIDLLGTKAIRLAGLTKGTEEYREQVELLTGELKQNNQATAQAAANAAKDLFAQQKYSSLGSFRDEGALFEILSNNGFNVKNRTHTEGDFWKYLLDPFGTGGSKSSYTTSEINLSGNVFEDEETLDNLVKFLLENNYGETDFYNKIYAAWEERNNAITEYLNSYVPSYAFDDITNNEELDSIIDSVLEATKIINAELSEQSLKDYRNTIESIIKAVSGYKRQETEETKKQTNNIQDQIGKYDDLIKKLEELRDLNKEAYDWEEKKKAVIEAEQALLAAQNEATVRRFNQETSQWEWQTDEKAIKEAEENLEKAKLDLEEAAYDNIIDQLEEQTATNESILAILKEVAPLLGEDFSNAVQNAIKDKTGVDITQPVISSEVSHDNGGLALGKGFLNKATSRPESVNNPELTAKILSPVSNEQFNRYVRDMGILFETARQYQQSPVIERIGGATDNRVDNSGQINFSGGITFPKEAQNYSLNQLLAQYKSMSNN